MEEYLTKLNLKDDENTLQTIVHLMEEGLIRDIDIHTRNDDVFIVHRSSRISVNTKYRIETLTISFLKLFFKPYEKLYPNINFYS